MFPAKQSTGEKTSGNFWKTEFPHPGGITLRCAAETEMWKQQQRQQQPELYFLTNYKIRMIHYNIYQIKIARKKVSEKKLVKKSWDWKKKLSKVFLRRKNSVLFSALQNAQDKNFFY